MANFTASSTARAVSRMPMPFNVAERLIVALDFDSADKAIRLVDELDGLISVFKVGIQLQLAGGMRPVQYLLSKGKKVFLDLKYNDVPETVELAVREAASKGVTFLTIHGNGPTVRAAVKGRGDNSELKLLSVTVLTSLDAADMKDMGFEISVEDLVLYRAKKALEAGCDGVVASGQEAAMIRKVVGPKLLIVTPGIRPEGFPKQDQKRTVSPREAVLNGADYLVVGRYIATDPHPRQAAERVLAEMQEGFATLVNP
jgi:orotidine-5'-phosphate decarboxylase